MKKGLCQGISKICRKFRQDELDKLESKKVLITKISLYIRYFVFIVTYISKFQILNVDFGR